jgi:hypothetical protein
MINNEIKNITVRSSEDLCKIAEILGYKKNGRFACNQLQCSNGAFVSSLLSLLDDNPDLMDLIKEWLVKSNLIESADEDEDSCDYSFYALEECVAHGKHLDSCDEDGYCKMCGRQSD